MQCIFNIYVPIKVSLTFKIGLRVQTNTNKILGICYTLFDSVSTMCVYEQVE